MHFGRETFGRTHAASLLAPLVLAAKKRTEISMDLKDVLAQLREERDKLDVAITTLERLDYGHHRGPGRPPGLVTKSPTNGIQRGYRLPDPEPGEGSLR